jgi:adenylate cyclase
MARIGHLVKAFGGRVVDTTGDCMLAEFRDGGAATRCAAAAQHALQTTCTGPAAERPMQFRIGLHHGEVIARGGRLYGHVVNVAARLQSMADPGGILMSDAAAERCCSDDVLDEAGTRRLKNVPHLIHTFRARLRD